MKKILLTAFSISMISLQASASFLPSSFTAKFEQEYVSTLKGKVKKGTGSIEYQYPGQIRFETTTPSTVIFVSNGSRSWYYRAPFIEGEQGEVTESNAKDGSSVYIKFFDSLKNGLTSNSYYDVKASEAPLLTFMQSAQEELGIKSSRLYFKAKTQNFQEIDTIELIFKDGKSSKLKLIDLKTNVGGGSSRFNFIAPPNTKTTK